MLQGSEQSPVGRTLNTVKGLESTQWPCDDLEYTYPVAPEHIGRLRAALGAIDDDDLVELLAQRY